MPVETFGLRRVYAYTDGARVVLMAPQVPLTRREVGRLARTLRALIDGRSPDRFDGMVFSIEVHAQHMADVVPADPQPPNDKPVSHATTSRRSARRRKP